MFIPMLNFGAEGFGLRRSYLPVFEADDGNGGGAGDDAAAAAAAVAAAAAAKNTPSDAEAKMLREVMTLKAKLAAAEKERLAIATKFDGIDPDAVKALLAERKTAEEDALRRAGDFDKLKERMADEHKRETDNIRKLIVEKESAVAAANAQINDLTVGSAFRGSKFVVEDTVLTGDKARRLYGDHFDVVDGKVVPFDAPRGDFSRMALIDGSGRALPFDEAMKRIVEKDPDRDSLLRSKRQNGSGVGNRANLPPGNGATENKAPDLFGTSRIASALKARAKA